MKVVAPPIKSQGIKTKLVPWINTLIPHEFSDRWVEPFMGTGVVGLNLAKKSALLCDTNPHLINFYTAIQTGSITPEIAKEYLQKEGNTLREKGQEHYNFIRSRFNEDGNPLDFLFINRSGFNGMIRFNKKGGFNIPFCHKPNRFAQAYVTRITNQIQFVKTTIEANDFIFRCQNFDETISKSKATDIIYCDPPYIGRHVDYYNGWSEKDERDLFITLNKTPCKFILSTWHHNDFRSNAYIDLYWNKFNILTREHFYHVGGKEKNRNPMIEAIITNIPFDHTKTLTKHSNYSMELL